MTKETLAQQEQPAQEPVAWMVYNKEGTSVMVTDNPTDISDGMRALPLYTAPPTQPAFTQEPPAKTGARIQAIVTSCLGCTHRRYNSGGIYYCEKLGSDLDPRETFHPLCPLQSLSPTQPALPKCTRCKAFNNWEPKP